MANLTLHGRITEAGSLNVELPEGLPPGEVRIDIEYTDPILDSEQPTHQVGMLPAMPTPMPKDAFIAWLMGTPVVEAWGDLADDEDDGAYIHRKRRQNASWLDQE